ncbi:growth factor receptor-bound protein 14-like isoform X2 [Bacillus rossius redtenbacheri]|uniref:growth factor receptor-bound protein 14-like isoform X2 n=1 Tax=Bacillus rossius redtenbacheri TaxID=93214 RepID=UPI002FDE76D7
MSSFVDICGLRIVSVPHHHHLHSCIHLDCACPKRHERMKCSCLDGAASSYQRLPSVPSVFELAALCEQEAASAEHDHHACDKEEELAFYNDDGSYQTVVVEANLCASDLCQLLALKNRVAKDVNWTIVEHWLELGLERTLEDHEDVLRVHRNMEVFGKHTEKRFIFRKDFRKYEFFHNPQQFFPVDMVDLAGYDELAGNGSALAQNTALQTMLTTAGECPPIFSHVWVREANRQLWNKAFLLLKDKKLYLTYKVQVVAKFLRGQKNKSFNRSRVGTQDPEGQLQVWALLEHYDVYTTLNARNQFRAPTEFGLCLRPTEGAAGESCSLGLKCLACESERARLCWVTAMRLAKYGKQLRENYRAFKNKQVESMSPKEYGSYTVPNESVRSRVAMDFTGSVGRIVDDPKEAKAIAVAEGYSWKRRWRPAAQRHHSAASPGAARGLEAGVHVAQPWFHGGMSRDHAAQLVGRHGTVDGVFLVRESRSNPGAFVLTFKCGGKVLHSQIQPVVDQVRDAVCYSLDSGVTKFYDLLQLVEFYQLNAGCLPTRLTHYVVQSPTGPLFSEKPMGVFASGF